MNYYEVYATRRDALTSLLHDAASFFAAHEKEDQAQALNKLADDVAANVFSIVLVGEFSAGKSTFLNALMRKKLLPSFTGETTATVNFLMHRSCNNDQEGGRVFYYDGREEIMPECTLEAIEQVVSTRGNREVAKEIERVELYIDSDFLKNGVLLVDSPGLNGVADGHREITQRQILRSHASIFMFSADHPGSKTDFKYLQELKSKVSTVLFVLNKIDDIKPSENETVESVTEKLKQSYHDQFPQETTIPEIWPVAAYPALVARTTQKLDYQRKSEFSAKEKAELEINSRMAAFEERLWRFLTNGEKTKQQLLSPVQRTRQLAEEFRTDTLVRLEALQSEKSPKELEEQMRALEEEQRGLEGQTATFKGEVSKKIETVCRDVIEQAQAEVEKRRERALRKVDQLDDLDLLNEYLETFPKWYINDLNRLSESLDDANHQEFMMLVVSEYQQFLGEVQERLSQSSGIKLNLQADFDSGEEICSVGLEAFDNKRKELQQEIDALSGKLEEKELAGGKARRAEAEKQQLQNRLENEMAALRSFQETIGISPLPSVEQRSKEKLVERERKGIFGRVANFFAGPRDVYEVVTMEDDTNYRNAKEQRAKTQQEYADRIAELRAQCTQVQVDEVPEEIDVQIRRLQRECDEKRQKLSDSMAQFSQAAKKKNAMAIRRAKSRLSDYCEDAAAEFIREARSVLRGQQAQLAQMLSEVVGSSIMAKLDRVKAQMEQVKQELATEGQKRTDLMQDLQQALEVTENLIERAASLEAEIECVQTDVIEETAI